MKSYTITFNEDQLLELLQMRRAAGVGDNGEVIKRALGLFSWALDEVRVGRKVGSFAEGGPVKEIVLTGDKWGTKRG